MPEQVTQLEHGKMLIDGLGKPPISPGLVAIAGTRVVYAGSKDNAPESPPQAKVLDVGQACLLPGLIDVHVHANHYDWSADTSIPSSPDWRTC